MPATEASRADLLARIDERVKYVQEQLESLLSRMTEYMTKQEERTSDIEHRLTIVEERTSEFQWLKRLLFGSMFGLVVALALALYAVLQGLP